MPARPIASALLCGSCRVGPPTGDLHPVYNAPMLGDTKECRLLPLARQSLILGVAEYRIDTRPRFWLYSSTT